MVAAVQLVSNNSVVGTAGNHASGGGDTKGGDGFSKLLSVAGGGADPADSESASLSAGEAEALVRDRIADGKDILPQAVALVIPTPADAIPEVGAAGDMLGKSAMPVASPDSEMTPLLPFAEVGTERGSAGGEKILSVLQSVSRADMPVLVSEAKNTGLPADGAVPLIAADEATAKIAADGASQAAPGKSALLGQLAQKSSGIPGIGNQTAEADNTDELAAVVKKAAQEIKPDVPSIAVRPEDKTSAPAKLELVTPLPQAAVAGASGESSADAGSQQSGQQGGSTQATPLPSVSGQQAPLPPVDASAVRVTGFAQQLAHASGVPVLDQVLVHLRSNPHDGSSRIQIQLDPAELGRVEIRLDVGADGKTGVTVTADNRAALDALQRDARGLERALSDAGLKADAGSLSFNLRGEQNDQQGRQRSTPQYPQLVQDEEEIQALGHIVSRTLSLMVNDGLDIKI